MIANRYQNTSCVDILYHNSTLIFVLRQSIQSRRGRVRQAPVLDIINTSAVFSPCNLLQFWRKYWNGKYSRSGYLQVLQSRVNATICAYPNLLYFPFQYMQDICLFCDKRITFDCCIHWNILGTAFCNLRDWLAMTYLLFFIRYCILYRLPSGQHIPPVRRLFGDERAGANRCA